MEVGLLLDIAKHQANETSEPETRKKVEYKPNAKNESVQAFLSLQPGQRITIEFESIAADEGDSLTAAVSLCDHLNKQAYSERLFKVVSINANV